MMYQIGPGLSPIGKRLLVFYAIVYIAELLLEHWLHIPVARYLCLAPWEGQGFYPWQLVSSLFVHDPRAPILFLINCVMFYFFTGPVEYALGSRRFLGVFFAAGLGGNLCGLAFSAVSGFNAPFCGMLPSLLALLVVFGFLNPRAMVLLMFVLPIQAKYISYLTLLITALTFLAKANPYGAYHLGGIMFGYAVFRGPVRFHEIQLLRLKWAQWRLMRKKARFTVIKGGKNKKDDKPTYH